MMNLRIALVFTLVLQCFGQQGSGITSRLQAGGRAQAQADQQPGISGHGSEGGDIPFEQLPEWAQRLEGSTITGNVMIGGIGLVPAHGGLGVGNYSSGLREGWGADPHAPMPRSLSMWTPPSMRDSDFLRRISSDFLSEFQRGRGTVNVNPVGPTSTPISDASGARIFDVSAASTGMERPRVDSFVLGSDIQGIVPAPGSGQVESIVDYTGRQVLRSDNPGMSPFASGAPVQQVGFGMPERRATEFSDTSVIPGSSTGPVAGVFPSAGTGVGVFPDSGLVDVYGRRRAGSLRGLVDVYGRRRAGSLRPKRSTPN